MNNLLSYFGLADSRMRASDIDLPVTNGEFYFELIYFRFAKGFKNIFETLCAEA